MTPREPRLIDVTLIRPGRNDRTRFEAKALRSLADSINANGLIQPLTVRELNLDGEPLGLFEIVAGERRFRACCLLGWGEVPALVADLTDEEASGLMLAENLIRQDLSPLEEARAFEKRMRQFGWDRAEVARRASVHEGTVRNRLALLLLCPEAQFLLEKESLPLVHAQELAALDANRQILALRLFAGSKIPPIGEFRSYCREALAAQSQESLFDATEYYLARQEEQTGVRGGAASGAGVAVHPTLPLPRRGPTVAAVLDSYLADLRSAGAEEAALVVGSVYDALVRNRLITLPIVREAYPSAGPGAGAHA